MPGQITLSAEAQASTPACMVFSQCNPWFNKSIEALQFLHGSISSVHQQNKPQSVKTFHVQVIVLLFTLL